MNCICILDGDVNELFNMHYLAEAVQIDELYMHSSPRKVSNEVC